MSAVRDKVERLTRRAGAAAGNLPAILLTGETGTGKDLMANYIHAMLPGRSGPFVALNCTAVPAELFESELFGHQRGAFSGATADRPGLLETADGGTLFLDEIGDLPLPMQPKLLRALETRAVRRIGDNRDRSFDLCLIAATNRSMSEQVAQGRFREDLYYRLKVVTIELPPLRERGDDILLLADAFCGQLAAKYNIPGLRLTEEARQSLLRHAWPGNVRELQHALESAALTAGEATVGAAQLPLPAGPDPLQRARQTLSAGQPIHLEEVERTLIEQALEQTQGNVSAAARLLSIGREAMRYRMAKFGLGGESVTM
jgi:DNA-binding NtrC family response regulator